MLISSEVLKKKIESSYSDYGLKNCSTKHTQVVDLWVEQHKEHEHKLNGKRRECHKQTIGSIE